MSASGAFVGRRDELRVLGERLASARAGRPQVVYLEGEPGSGKSSLLSTFVGSVSNALVLEVSGDEAESLLSYGLFDQLQPGTATDPGLDPMAAGAQLSERLAQSQAGGQTVVMVIDDLQWADRPSSRAVLFALRRLRADAVLTLLSARVGGLTDPGWARFVTGDSRVTRIRLAGLGTGELTELARALRLGALSQQGASRLAAHTEGNALYCRALLDEIGVVGLNAPVGSGFPAPRELSAVILARVAALPPAAQEFLSAASVIGQHAPLSMIAAVARIADPHHEVDSTVAAGLVREGVSPAELAFVHPLYRSAVYADLSPTSRRTLHARAAGLVSGRARLGHQVAATLGPDDGLAGELEASSMQAAAAGDAAAAAWALEQAAALSSVPEDRERRLLDAAVVLLNSADTPAAERVLASCQLSSARHDALTGLLGVFKGSPDAEDRLLAAWRAHDQQGEAEIGARAATSLTNWMVISGRPDQALMWADRAVGGTAAGSPVRAMARAGQAFAYAAAGRSPEGLRVLDFLPVAGGEAAMSDTDALIMRGILNVYVDDLSGAIVDLTIAAARLRSRVPSTYPGPCLAHLSDAHFRRGDWDSAISYAQSATSWAQDADRPLDLARAHARLAQVLAFRGDWETAQAHLGASRVAAGRFPMVLAIACAAVAGASLASARGDLSGVLAATEQVRATKRLAVGGLPGIFNWRGMEADALIGLGRIADAEKALTEFEEAIPSFGPPSAALMVARCRGQLAVARGDSRSAEAAYARAHLLESQVAMPFEHALLSLHDGRRLRSTGDAAAAHIALDTARRIFSELGAQPYVRLCLAELADLQSPPAVEDHASSLSGLSRAELAVARLVATGLTNREVAGQLFLSVKTVEYHLRNVYMKLDITSRRALADLVR